MRFGDVTMARGTAARGTAARGTAARGTAARAAVAALRLGALRGVNQPAGLASAAVFHLMVTSVLGGLWHTAAVAGDGPIVGYGPTALVWYIAIAEAAVICLPIKLIEEVGEGIGSGDVEIELLRPLPPLGLRVAIEIGRMLPRLGACAATGVVFSLVVGGPPEYMAALVLAGPALILAASVNLVAQHAFAGTSFWIRDGHSAWFLYQKLVLVLGGVLLPLQVLPRWLELVARVLPFSAMAYAPGRLASGHFEPELLAVQGFWLIALAGATGRLYRAGERRLTEVAR